MARTMYEFYCSGGCLGYTLVPLDPEIDEDIIMVCPNCQHEHMRRMKGGQVTDLRHSTTRDDDRVHRIEPTKSAFSQKERLGALQKAKAFVGDLWGRNGI